MNTPVAPSEKGSFPILPPLKNTSKRTVKSLTNKFVIECYYSPGLHKRSIIYFTMSPTTVAWKRHKRNEN